MSPFTTYTNLYLHLFSFTVWTLTSNNDLSIRTPVRDTAKAGPSRSLKEEESRTMTEGAGPGLSTALVKRDAKVRRSIGEIEARTNATRTKVRSSPTSKPSNYKTRTAEAKACLMKAKMQIG